jgi:hypothetical protein
MIVLGVIALPKLTHRTRLSDWLRKIGAKCRKTAVFIEIK